MKTKIIYEDKDILVIQKPSGLATQTSKVGQQDVVSELKNYLAMKVPTGHPAGHPTGHPTRRRSTECPTGQSVGYFTGQSAGRYPTEQSVGSIAGHSKTEPYLGIIHRLDQPVEGLLVFAKNKKAAAALTAQLHGEKGADAAAWRGEGANLTARSHGDKGVDATAWGGEGANFTAQPHGVKESSAGTLNKFYYGVFCGSAPGGSGELIDYLYKDSSGKALIWEQCKGEKPPQVKHAVLQYCTLQTEQVQGIVLSLVKIHISTGRYHQIRAQMSHAGMSLLGDSKYADTATRAISEKLSIRNVALCAFDLEFYHPSKKEKMNFQIKPQGEAFSFFSIK